MKGPRIYRLEYRDGATVRICHLDEVLFVPSWWQWAVWLERCLVVWARVSEVRIEQSLGVGEGEL